MSPINFITMYNDARMSNYLTTPTPSKNKKKKKKQKKNKKKTGDDKEEQEDHHYLQLLQEIVLDHFLKTDETT